MRSPFPGMDPYIESCDLWEDFHDKIIGEIERALAATVPDHYAVRLAERSYIELATREGDREYRAKADVAITTDRLSELAASPGPATAVLESVEIDQVPITMRAFVEIEHRETFVEIRELHPERRLVTTIEVLSPANKKRESPGWFQYQRKRQAHLEGNANLVEIDLLRGDHRMPMQDEWPTNPYYVLVSRRKQAPICQVWPAHFVCALPEIPVPLDRTDPDVALAIQPMIEAIYTRSRYERDIDYRQPCQPPLHAAEAAWLQARLREHQARA